MLWGEAEEREGLQRDKRKLESDGYVHYFNSDNFSGIYAGQSSNYIL